MMRKFGLLSVLSLWVCTSLQAARVDTLMVYSPSMKKTVEVVFIVPDQSCGKNPQSCPVVYLLHGHGGNAKTWIGIKPELPAIADEKGMIFVCPDAENSWYWDSPLRKDYRYETFVASELVDYTDSHYATRADRKFRAISGLSMGGHGALWLSIRHKDTFGAAASMSGGADIRPFPDSWNMKEQLGEYASNKDVWDAHTVMSQLDRISNGDIALLIDCGDDDFFLEVNQELHRQLLSRKIGHDFITRPGAHTVTYWNNSIDYHLLFFQKFFTRGEQVGQ